jgi:micrococcal nuclease
MYTYSCKILRIVDGDTVDVDIDLGFGVWMHRERVRMYGIDTPESRTSDPEEKVYGKLSKQFVKDNLPIGSMQTLVTHKDKTGKFGRILGDFLIEDKSLGDIMVDKSLAVRYNGEDKAEIQMKHLLNRNTLLHEGTVTVDDFN